MRYKLNLIPEPGCSGNDGVSRWLVEFSQAERLPEGYNVEYWECDEGYHYTTPDPNFESERRSTVKQAWIACIGHAKQDEQSALQERMKRIVFPRCKGKTTELIKMSAEHGYYIVSLNSKSVENTVKMANKLGLRIPFPITHQAFLEKRYYAKGIKGFLFDDLDIFIQNLTSVKIAAITISE